MFAIIQLMIYYIVSNKVCEIAFSLNATRTASSAGGREEKPTGGSATLARRSGRGFPLKRYIQDPLVCPSRRHDNTYFK